MTAPAPATKFDELYTQAISYLRKQAWPSEFELRRLEREALNLSNATTVGSLEIRAHIAAYKSDFASAVALYDRALSLTADFMTLLRGMNVMQIGGESRWVFEKFKRHHDAIVSSPEAMRGVEVMLACSGYFRSAMELADRMSNAGIERDPLLTSTATPQYPLQERGRDDVEVAEVVACANRFLFDRKVRVRALQPTVIALESGEDSLLVTFHVHVAPETAAQLEWDLYGELGERSFPVEESGSLRLVLAADWDELEARPAEKVEQEGSNAYSH
ncbi:hypothetical protein [Luteimonas sp. 3794]|uniref:hypothetical protein n=1 Tax=Luteimonas sp. 3794 TaxID=2817730 RepID=UPI00285E7DAD|nr:hypothetical protein [Luteimonas sp. 3794]MDR6992852.1 hypothetical protein [Luteimonas sp. 3794]